MTADIKPVAYLVTGGRAFVDRAFCDGNAAMKSAKDRNDGATVELLYPQSAIDSLRAEVERVTRWNERVSVCRDHTGDIVDGECVVCRAERAEAEVARLRELAGCAYQLAGYHDAPEAWLDALGDAANGTPLAEWRVQGDLIETLLPYTPDAALGGEDA